MLVLLTVCDLLVDVWALHRGLWEGHMLVMTFCHR